MYVFAGTCKQYYTLCFMYMYKIITVTLLEYWEFWGRELRLGITNTVTYMSHIPLLHKLEHVQYKHDDSAYYNFHRLGVPEQACTAGLGLWRRINFHVQN